MTETNLTEEQINFLKKIYDLTDVIIGTIKDAKMIEVNASERKTFKLFIKRIHDLLEELKYIRETYDSQYLPNWILPNNFNDLKQFMETFSKNDRIIQELRRKLSQFEFVQNSEYEETLFQNLLREQADLLKNIIAYLEVQMRNLFN